MRDLTLGEDIVIVGFVIAVLCGLGYMGYDIMNESSNFQQRAYECLTPIAEEYCKEINMVYLSGRVYYNRFVCFETFRSSMGETYYFTKNETEDCKLFADEVQDE